MAFEIHYHPDTVKDFKAVPSDDRQRIKEKIEKILSRTPYPSQHKACKKINGLYRFRSGNFRVFYEINGRRIDVLRIKYRKDSYR